MKQIKSPMPWLITSVLCMVLCFTACQKDTSVEIPEGSQNLSIYLTDNPALFDKVLIDIRQLEVCVDTGKDNSGRRHDDDDDDNSGRGSDDDDDDDDDDNDDSCNWQNISIRTGVYDLLKLRNGVDTLLGSSIIPAGRIRKIRLTLGDNNTLVMDSISYPLTLQGSNQRTVLIKVSDDDIRINGNGQASIHIDFDAGRSILFKDNRFLLFPQIKSFCDEKSARIEGRVLPLAASPVLVSVYNTSDTSIAVPDSKDGKFKVRGLKDGSYSVSFKASQGYRDTTLHNIVLTRGTELKLPVIQLRK